MSTPPVVYVASSWKTQLHDPVVHNLKIAGLNVYDYRDPPDDVSFSFREVDPQWERWSPKTFARKLREDARVRHAFERDRHAIEVCDILVMVMPCGRSAHLELGYASGLGKRTIILAPQATQPELMYGLASEICTDFGKLLETVGVSGETGRWEP